MASFQDARTDHGKLDSQCINTTPPPSWTSAGPLASPSIHSSINPSIHLSCMRFRPFTWLLLSLFLFVAAAVYWRLCNQWAAKKAAASAATTAPRPSAPGVRPSPPAPRPSTLPTQTPAIPGSGPVATNANPTLAYRLSNTTKTIGQLARSDKAVLLENALLDTTRPANLPIPDSLRSHGDPGS